MKLTLPLGHLLNLYDGRRSFAHEDRAERCPFVGEWGQCVYDQGHTNMHMMHAHVGHMRKHA